MSWSFYAMGKPKAVIAKADAEFERIVGYCAEPERSIASKAHEAIKAVLDAMPDSSAVDIRASGSQSVVEGGTLNNLSLDIKPIYGFVE